MDIHFCVFFDGDEFVLLIIILLRVVSREEKAMTLSILEYEGFGFRRDVLLGAEQEEASCYLFELSDRLWR